ncbi:hypothetical protein FHS19_005904 [Paenibacillus rhizosphaerae]|uniref:DUF4025 domain-containing protein n=1 Tax=Paenibacillus rhizosphaerae TaxID=297318 RepID=A0A839TVJ9_9BACL|nr:hypothetical protein [Paenibacillus rhizosphaerae]MBB3131184.1 hypothetical protein [Paenibacillus rhizosphaerae]
MEKDNHSANEAEAKEQAAKANHNKVSEVQDTEFAGELSRSDIKSAFKNPITGEERLY